VVPTSSETAIVRRDVQPDGSVVARWWHLPDDWPLPDCPPSRETYYPAEVVAAARPDPRVIEVGPE
jgi:hypothetical protein